MGGCLVVGRCSDGGSGEVGFGGGGQVGNFSIDYIFAVIRI